VESFYRILSIINLRSNKKLDSFLYNLVYFVYTGLPFYHGLAFICYQLRILKGFWMMNFQLKRFKSFTGSFFWILVIPCLNVDFSDKGRGK